MTLFLVLALVAALVTFGGSVLVWKLSLKYRLYPKIRERDVHTRPTPRLGGIAMFVGIVAAICAAAFVSAFFCVRWLIRFVSHHDFTPFAWYRIVFGALLLAIVS